MFSISTYHSAESNYAHVGAEVHVGGEAPVKDNTMEMLGMSIMSGVPSFATGYVLGKFVFKESDFYSSIFGAMPGLIFNIMAATMGRVNPIAGTVSSIIASYVGTRVSHHKVA
jgi:hypothetical protein